MRAGRCLAIILAYILTGCDIRPVGTDTEGRVVLRSIAWSATPKDVDMERELVRDFEKLHPNIRVQFEIIEQAYDTKLLTSLAADNAPDVFWVNAQTVRSYINRKALMDLKPLAKRDDLSVDDYYPVAITPFVVDEGLYAVPYSACAVGIFFNKDMFAREQIQEPCNNWTWDQFIEAARKLTKRLDDDPRIEQWGFVLPGDTMLSFPIIYSNGGQIFDPRNPDRLLLTQPLTLEGWNRLFDLVFKEKVAPLRGEGGDQDVRRGFQLGRIAMMISGWWDVIDIQDYAPNLNYGIAPIPIIHQAASVAYTTGHAVWSHTPHPSESWELVKFMTARDSQIRRLQKRIAAPSLKSVGRDPRFHANDRDKTLFEAMEVAQAVYGLNCPIMMDEITQARDRVLQEIDTTAQAFGRAEKNFQSRTRDD
ncbi:MAG: sugar ABC transporter substrate-binding protein [bacterium]|nr:sugar ABC transporter substrate-binding protein [Candidatus Sumerlaeota bacterium]